MSDPAPFLFAAIADDFTGGSDLAGMLHESGVPTVQLFGLPDDASTSLVRETAQAAVLSLKSRSIPAAEAVAASLDAWAWLRTLGPRQFQFKYCSTFDSAAEGNIGPVTEALLDALDCRFTVAVPSLPVNGRTQYMGNLFVAGVALADSPMRDHPITPMRDSNLVRHLARQMRSPVGLIDWYTVRRGPEAVREAASTLAGRGVRVALVDALDEADMAAIASGVEDYPLITGSSGLARHLPALWRERGLLPPLPPQPPAGIAAGNHPRTLILSGSCSAATLAQLEDLNGLCEPVRLRWRESPRAALEAAAPALEAKGLAAIASSAPPGERDTDPLAARRLELAFGETAAAAVSEFGVDRLIVAGGETSGAVVEALGVRAARLAGIVAPGVPALEELGERRLRLILKSGNFGGPRFFRDALAYWEEHDRR